MGKQTHIATSEKDVPSLLEFISNRNGILLDYYGNRVLDPSKITLGSFYIAFDHSVISLSDSMNGPRRLDIFSSDVIELFLLGEGEHHFTGEPVFHCGRIYLYTYREVPEWLAKEYSCFSRFIKKHSVRKHVIAPQFTIYIFPGADQIIKEKNLDLFP